MTDQFRQAISFCFHSSLFVNLKKIIFIQFDNMKNQKLSPLLNRQTKSFVYRVNGSEFLCNRSRIIVFVFFFFLPFLFPWRYNKSLNIIWSGISFIWLRNMVFWVFNFVILNDDFQCTLGHLI